MRAHRLLTVIAAVALGGAAPPAVPRPSARPLHVMSTNLCTDQIVLALLPPERIASVSWLARDPEGSLMATQARRVGVNHGIAEEVIGQRPDLVLAGTYTATAMRGLLHRLDWPLVEVPPADSIADIRATTRQIARAVGEPARGEALIARMDAKLRSAASRRAPPLRIAAWDGAGFSAMRGSLYDVVLRAAGAVNVAADPRHARHGVPDTELLLAAAPSLIVQGGASNRGSLRADTAYHSVVRRIWGRDRTIVVRPAYYICGTPLIGDAVLALREELRAKAGTARSPLPFAARPL